jgi:hypothetical protein
MTGLADAFCQGTNSVDVGAPGSNQLRVKGLFLEGATWDEEKCCLEEAMSKFETQLPTVRLSPKTL